MRIVLAAVVVAITLGSAHGQTCLGQLTPVQPAMYCLNPASVCVCGPAGGNCHWGWVCPSAPAAPRVQLDSSIPLGGRPPVINDPVDTMRRMQEIRQMREQNQQWAPAADYSTPSGPYLGLAVATMPKPTGNAKKDRRAWEKWQAKLDPDIQGAIPSWSPEAYQQLRKNAVAQAFKGR